MIAKTLEFLEARRQRERDSREYRRQQAMKRKRRAEVYRLSMLANPVRYQYDNLFD